MKKVAFFILLFTSLISYGQKAKIRIIATGGTIAGVGSSKTQSNYEAGKLGIQDLIDAVPEINDIADVSGEQLVKIGSQDMNDEIWLKLAKRINELLNKENYDGVVITHGTDTMEETAYFLNLSVHSKKPVVLVGAMRPATGMSADGPLNLYNAVKVATEKKSVGRGVLICMDELVLDAKGAKKTHTTSAAAFESPDYGALARIHNGKVFYFRSPENKHTYQSEFNVDNLAKLPKVGIIYSYSNASDIPIKSLISAKFDGIVIAGVGNGNIYKDIFETSVKAENSGIQIVRSSRVQSGATTSDAEVDDEKYHFVASKGLNPQKARVLLMMALTKTKDWKKSQEYFNQY